MLSSYAELRQALARHEVRSVTLVPPRSQINAIMADGNGVSLSYPPSDEALPALLLRSGAEVMVRNESEGGNLTARS